MQLEPTYYQERPCISLKSTEKYLENAKIMKEGAVAARMLRNRRVFCSRSKQYKVLICDGKDHLIFNKRD